MDGYTVRAPRLTDAEAILGLMTEYHTPLVGFADYTLDDVKDELVEPGFVAETDGWLVFDAGQRLVGYGWACRNAGSDIVDIDVVSIDPDITRPLFDRAVDRALAIGRELGHPRITVDQGIYRVNEPMRELAASYGFEPSTTYHRMRIDHTGTVPMPEPPPGVVVRTGETVARAAYELEMRTFTDHHGHFELTYDEWYKQNDAKSTFDWSQLTVLEIEGSPVAVCRRTDQFVGDENCGYVAKIGVGSEARGRGLAKYLLRRTFAIDAAAGRAGTILHVDTNNVTPALGLYTSVGMRPFLVIDVWRTVMPAAASASLTSEIRNVPK